MKPTSILAGVLAFAASSIAVAVAGGGANFDRLADADRKILQERFAKEIWPLMERNGKQGCVGCHRTGTGGNAMRLSGKVEKDFRMLVKEGFFIPDDSGSVLTRVMSNDKKQRMPPPGKGERWSKADIEMLKKFVTDLDKKQLKK